MSHIIRSGKFIRYFSNATWTFVHSRKGHNYNVLQYTRSLALDYPQRRRYEQSRGQATNAERALSIDPLLQRLDADVRRHGRLSRHDLDEVVEEVRLRHSVSSSQSLLIIRCCGDLVPEELPAKRTQLVKQIWQTLMKRKVPMDISHYNALLRVYIENEHDFSPGEFLKELQDKGLEPNRVTYQRLMWRHCQSGDVEGASCILELMREQRLPLSSAVLDALVLGHVRQGDTAGARAVLTAMKGAGLSATPRTHALLLGGVARLGDLSAMEALLEECKANEIYLSDKDLMDVIEDCAVSGHEENIPFLLEQMPRSSGYNQEVVSLVLRLVTRGRVQAALLAYRSMARPNSPEEKAPVYQGAFFVRHLVRAGCPADITLDVCKQLQDEGHVFRAYDIAAHAAVQCGKFNMAVPLFQAIITSGNPVRQHYFWPLLLSEYKTSGADGVLNVIRTMTNDFKIALSQESLRDYVLPCLEIKNPMETVDLLRSANVSTASAGRAVVSVLLSENKLTEAAKLSIAYGIQSNLRLTNKQLIRAFAVNGDVEALVSIVHLSVSDNLNNNKFSSKRDGGDEEETSDIIDKTGQFINDLVRFGNGECASSLSAVLETLLAKGLGISSDQAEKIQEKLGDRLTPQISDLLSKLLSDDLEPILVQSPNIPNIKRDSTQLESLIENSDGETGASLKKQLLVAYMRENNHEKVLEYLAKLEVENFTLTAGLTAAVSDFFARVENLDRALHYREALLSKNPDFLLDKMKTMRLVHLLLTVDQFEKAMDILDADACPDRPNPSGFLYNSLAWKTLNHLAEQGAVDKIQKMFKFLLEKSYIQVTNPTLGLLVKVHLVKQDVNGALEALERCCREHQSTPWKAELTRTLIAAEDAAALQRLTDLSTTVHGEVNSLYDLVFGFVECGRLRQARRILETPGMRARSQRFNSACQRYGQEGKVECLEGLLEASRELSHIDRSEMFQQLLISYTRARDVDKALGLWTLLQEEAVPPTDKFLISLSTFLRSENKNIPFVVPAVISKTDEPKNFKTSQTTSVTKLQSKKTEGDENNISTSSLIKLVDKLVHSGQLEEASELFQKSLKNDKINVRPLRFLMIKLSAAGNITALNKIGELLTENQKKSLSFDNNKCKAYLAAGKTDDFMDILESKIKTAKDEDLPRLEVEFPGGSLVNMISADPSILPKLQGICDKYASRDIIKPWNAVWTHYILDGQLGEARRVWDCHLCRTKKIQFKQVLENADSRVASTIVALLKENPHVTSQALAHAYSNNIGKAIRSGRTDDALQAVEVAMSAGVLLDELDQAILEKLKTAVEGTGGVFHYQVSEKTTSKI